MRRNIDKEIESFANSISDIWREEPLDSDEVEEISKLVYMEIDSRNGNV
jgi:hypothetical protein